jgi:hypothetical protein
VETIEAEALQLTAELSDEAEDILYEHTEELVGYIGQWLGEDTMSVTQCRCFVSRLAENLNKYIG